MEHDAAVKIEPVWLQEEARLYLAPTCKQEVMEPTLPSPETDPLSHANQESIPTAIPIPVPQWKVKLTPDKKTLRDSGKVKLEMIEDNMCGDNWEDESQAVLKNEIEIEENIIDLGDCVEEGTSQTGKRQWTCGSDESSFSQLADYILVGRSNQGPNEHDAWDTCSSKRLVEFHTEEGSHRCRECGKDCTSTKCLATHLRTHAVDKRFKCKECDQSFDFNSEFTNHLRTHRGEKPYKCEECATCFTTAGNFRIHLRTHTLGRLYKCKVCQQLFYSKSSAYSHLKKHNEAKLYTCKVCDSGFVTNYQLRRHLKIHERRYNCKECEGCFRSKRELTVHVRTHTDTVERSYKCTECDKCYTSKSHLSRHLELHTGETPHTCAVCGVGCITKQILYKHLALHTEDVPQ